MKKAMIALAAMAASGTAFAGAHSGGGSGPSWTFVDVGYLRADSGSDNETDGFQLRGSYEFATKWHVRFEYFDYEEEFSSGTNADEVDGYAVYLGGHPALTSNTDIVWEIGYVDFDFEEKNDPSFSGGGDAFTIGAGLRSMITDNVDVWGMIVSKTGDEGLDGSSSPDDDFTDINIHLGGQYLVNENFGIGLEYSEQDDFMNAFLRYQW